MLYTNILELCVHKKKSAKIIDNLLFSKRTTEIDNP